MARIAAFCLMVCVLTAAQPSHWVFQDSGTGERLRAVSIVNGSVAWASGNHGSFTRTLDGGSRWSAGRVAGAEQLDFRDVYAVDANTAYLLSIGAGELSRIYKTTNGGQSWKQQFTNHNQKAFFDAFAFWNANHGIALSDPVNGRFLLISTRDGGETWNEIPPRSLPSALAGEGAFAASGTCIAVQGKNNVWFATGGGEIARVIRSSDGGKRWQVSATPIRSGESSSGIFSIAFPDALRGVIVGGNYRKEDAPGDNAAVTRDGGKTWSLVKPPLPGYRSCVAYVPRTQGPTLVAVGPTGADYSRDDGATWTSMECSGFHAVSFAGTDAGWAVGEDGRLAKFVDERLGGQPKTNSLHSR